MAMELEFWLSDGPDGECLDFAVRVSIGTLIPQIDRYWRTDHAYAILNQTSRSRKEAWIVRVKPGYSSGTTPAVGRIEND